MIDPLTRPDRFILHSSITHALVDGWNLWLKGRNNMLVGMLSNYRVLERTDEFVRFEAFHWILNAWVRIRFRVYSNASKVRFTVWHGYGAKPQEAPLFDREPIDLYENDVQLFTIDDGQGEQALNGQSFTLRSFTIDFANGDYRDDPVNHTPRYAPRTPNQTGGNWPYMGQTHPQLTDQVARFEFYPVGRYPGVFLHADGHYVTEEDMPDAMGDSHWSRHAKDKGYIKYNHSEPWKDKPAGNVKNPDKQHFSVYCAMLQHAIHYPDDEGLRMITESLAHRYRRKLPGREKGGTYHTAGAERAQGRELMVGVWLWRALRAHGNDELAHKVGLRVIDRIKWQWAQWKESIAERGHPWAVFTVKGGGPNGEDIDGFAPHEVGIHYWGLNEVQEVLDKYGADIPELAVMRVACADYCFDSFRFWNFPGDRHWAVPYVRLFDGSIPFGPSSGSHFAWMAAVNHHPAPGEEDKLAAIAELGTRMEERWIS